MKRSPLAIIWLLPSLLPFSQPVRAEWLLDSSIALQINDNLPNASLDQDIKSDTAFDFGFSPGFYSQISGATSLAVSADLGITRQFDYKDLDLIAIGLTGSVRHKFGLGNSAPWARIAGSASYLEYKDGQRDGWFYAASIEGGKQLAEQLSIWGGYRFELRRAEQIISIPALVSNFGIGGEAFDTAAHNLDINAAYQINNQLSLVFGYVFRAGEITATTLRNAEIFEASDAIAKDLAFGPDRFAYRIEADTNRYSIGLSLACNNHMSLNATYVYQDSDAYEDLSYSNNLVRVELLYSY